MAGVLRNTTAPLLLPVKLMSEHARLPERKSAGAAGYDLYSAERKCIKAGRRDMVHTHIALKIPDGHYGRVAPRSSLALKSIDVEAGVIDSDYRGEVCIVLSNSSKEDFHVDAGDRIAQLILEKCSFARVVSVESLDGTKRGKGGFGSTGSK